ncbi:hypothetical protein F5146DRAFT_1005260 [Armillaria mellea]|nr:hypothetical protein F5146DRAFT_1005260 [Armillaria mellea]
MSPKLFQPIHVGSLLLKHGVVLVPMTRLRASNTHIPIVGVVKEYYEHRAHNPGTLLNTSATIIAKKAGGYEHVPGICNQDQTDGWNEGHTYSVNYAPGHVADPKVLASEDLSYVSISNISLSTETVAPRQLMVEEIRDIENRICFPLEFVDAIVEVVDPERVGYRISPWSGLFDMKMADSIPTFTFRLEARQPELAYLHGVEPRVTGMDDRNEHDIGAHEGNDFIWSL